MNTGKKIKYKIKEICLEVSLEFCSVQMMRTLVPGLGHMVDSLVHGLLLKMEQLAHGVH